MSAFTFEMLEALIEQRAQSGGETSYTAQLVAAGPQRIAKKLGEEGVEAALACAQGDEDELRAEAADLLYHMLVALHVRGIRLKEVLDELARRTGQSGLEEKASRRTQ